MLTKTPEEIEKHNEEIVSLAEYKQELKDALRDYDHYQHGMRILDTDYTNYMMLYHCQEDYPEVTKDETSIDIHSKLTHMMSVSIYLRDPNSYPEEKMQELIISLKEKVPGVNFDSTHKLIDHSVEKCPPGDLFLTAGSLNTCTLKDDLLEMEDFADISEHDDL